MLEGAKGVDVDHSAHEGFRQVEEVEEAGHHCQFHTAFAEGAREGLTVLADVGMASPLEHANGQSRIAGDVEAAYAAV